MLSLFGLFPQNLIINWKGWGCTGFGFDWVNFPHSILYGVMLSNKSQEEEGVMVLLCDEAILS